jgi:hypothetical protein
VGSWLAVALGGAGAYTSCSELEAHGLQCTRH